MSAIETLSGHTKFVECCSYSADGSRLVSCGGDQDVLLWDIERGKKQKIGRHEAEVWSCDFSKYGIYLCSCSSDKSVRIWDQRSHGEIATFHGHTKSVWSCAFDPSWSSWRIASGSSDTTVKIWNWKTLSVEETFERHRNTVEHVTFSQDGETLISCSRDKRIHLYEKFRNLTERNIKVFREHKGRVSFCDFVCGDERRILSCSDDKTLRIWDTVSGVNTHILKGHTNTVWCCDSRPLNDTSLAVSCSSDKIIRFWDLSDGTELRKITKMNDDSQEQLFYCRFSPDFSQVAVASDNGNIYLIKMKDILNEFFHRE